MKMPKRTGKNKLAGKVNITQSELKQVLNGQYYLGAGATRAELEAFADAAVDLINNRTLDGTDVYTGVSFTPYSEEYAKKKGVSRNSVDLFLDGDMLDSVDGGVSGRNIELEVGGSSTNKAKAYNHQTGDTLPARTWFGITAAEARAIANEIKSTRTQSTNNQEDRGFTLAELRECDK